MMTRKKWLPYLAKKLVIFLVSVLALSIIVFAVSRLSPRDPLVSYYGERTEKMSPAERQQTMERLGLNAPLTTQYVRWLEGALRGEFGISYKYKQDVLDVIAARIGNTLLLGLPGFILTFVLALLLGLVCAWREDSWLDKIISKAGTVLSCVPEFWLSLVLILFFSVIWRLLPSSGAYTIGRENDIGDRLRHLVLPMSVMILSHLWYYAYSQWESGEGYNRYITAELETFRKAAWKRQILRRFDARDAIRVLDVGTGPGFFACILSEEGLEVTAIDQSAGMLEKARENAAKLGVHPTFMHMNVNQMDFLDESFDVIVNRNVTSTLQYPEKLYAEFKRVLKPGGMLLIYDANWHAHLYDPELMKKVRAREEAHFRKYGTREVVTEDNPEFLATCPMTRYKRPEWDERVLTDLGFILNFL